ncbi:CHAP protein [Intrasporangium oryzae NRRL B-24470]|uniref:CHAP protein n=1 Tax=Intrasporangium oryzae NRRL B-24470 TaxID=1386089 RepID=W9G7U3_9MICO|nr:CHAP domain-containing protein [Intrasporangium oryzae]EWT02085.1 CHAP protein [Intrasporangium oryzae NRRL B-24470]
MNIDKRPGRHRAPGRHHPLTELRSIARESAQPAMKGAAIVAAAGGLVATVAQPASAETRVPAVAAPATAPAVVGPAVAAVPSAASALTSIGLAAATTAPRVATVPTVVIEDIEVKEARAKAAAEAKAKAAAAAKARAAAAAKARAAAAARASRSTTRTAIATKSTSNSYTPRASSGSRSSFNWATPGQCTWGALNKWHQSEGYYPGGWTGNAMAWAWGARSAGYTVSSTPRTRSILVMQPGVHGSSSVGHVAWVTRVSGNQVTIIEMNALAGPYNYNTRTLTQTSGMQYIYAP